jgi:hypothetical protein
MCDTLARKRGEESKGAKVLRKEMVSNRACKSPRQFASNEKEG